MDHYQFFSVKSKTNLIRESRLKSNATGRRRAEPFPIRRRHSQRWHTMRSEHQCLELEVGRKSDRNLAAPISAYCHPERSEQRERSRRISDSFAPAKPVPVLWIGLPGGFYLFTELLTQDTRRRVIALLDVNVLVALFDPAHVHHEAAHAWFGANRKNRWATCALTENGFVRVLS